MKSASDDKLATAVFALGLFFGFVRREDIVRWADRRIVEIDKPAMWLIDLSLSHNQRLTDLINDLNEISKGADPVAACKVALRLLPDTRGFSFDDAEEMARLVYNMTRHCIHNWDHQLLWKADSIDDTFHLVRSGYCTLNHQETIEQLVEFIEENRDKSMMDVLDPVAWCDPWANRKPKTPGEIGRPLVHIGLSAWIVQDGNYGDFAVDQDAKFALEFYPAHGLRPVSEGPAAAEHLTASRYRVRAMVVFANSDVWVIDAGTFMAFFEERQQSHVVVGMWVEGEVYLGIDPFFYFEYLHRLDGMPPLTYTWKVRQIMREITPWIEANDAKGPGYRTRDESKEAFVPIRETKAWDEDEGHAHYVLECEQLDGPYRPGAT